jgi:hypothetical protein
MRRTYIVTLQFPPLLLSTPVSVELEVEVKFRTTSVSNLPLACKCHSLIVRLKSLQMSKIPFVGRIANDGTKETEN